MMALFPILLLGFAIVLWAWMFPAYAEFRDFCVAVAEKEARVGELKSIVARDDGVFNDFESEILERIRTKNFDIFEDAELIGRARVLHFKLHIRPRKLNMYLFCYFSCTRFMAHFASAEQCPPVAR